MTFRTLFLFMWVALIATAAMAGEEQRTKIRIAIDGDDGERRIFRFDSDDAGFNLDELAIGESRTLEDGSGGTAVVSRTEDGFELEVGGEKIPLDGRGNHHDLEVMARLHADAVHRTKHMRVFRTEEAGGVTVISASEIDGPTRERLRDVLRDAGKEGDVMFIDGSELQDEGGPHGHREVRIIRKEINQTN